MPQGIGWVLFLLWFGFMVCYNGYLDARYRCSAMSLTGIVVAYADIFLWTMLSNAEEFSLGLLLFLAAALGLIVLLAAMNYRTVGHPLHALLMTAWQMMAAMVLFLWVYEVSRNKRKKK